MHMKWDREVHRRYLPGEDRPITELGEAMYIGAHDLIGAECACGEWTAPLGSSIYREFDKHLLEVARGVPTEDDLIPEIGWSALIRASIVQVTENWVVAVIPMIYNDRVVLIRRERWWSPGTGNTAGWCYDKGGAAHLAAVAWDPETERRPVGFKKEAFDARREPLEAFDE